jgi:hypothetical protein
VIRSKSVRDLALVFNVVYFFTCGIEIYDGLPSWVLLGIRRSHMDLTSLLTVDESLTDDTKLYRIVDFFAASQMITDHAFMFTRADQFSDPNEGIEPLLSQLEAASSGRACFGCGIGWTDSESATIKHKAIQRSYFISCWSANPESVAMWSLYSPDLCSVRLETTVGQLRNAALQLMNRYSVYRFLKPNSEKSKAVTVSGLITPVRYEDLNNICAKITRRFRAYKQLQNRFIRIERFDLLYFNRRNIVRERAREIAPLKTRCCLKDISFEHEKEVRVIVRLGDTWLVDALIEEHGLKDPSQTNHRLRSGGLLEFLQYLDEVQHTTLPKREFVKTTERLVNSVAIDPRCPEHKAAFIRNWLNDQNVPVVKSKCFGFVPDLLEIFPEQ